MATNNVSPKKGKVVDIPTVPTVGTATAGPESATVAFTAATIGGPATTYTAISSPGSITGTGSSSPVTVSGLTGGTSYTFTVRGNNATGNSEYSAASNSITALFNTSYESISTITVGAGGQSTISFTSIPSTYKHLQIRWISQNSSAAYYVQSRFNNDTTSSYATHRLVGNGATVSASGTFNESEISNTPQSATASIFGVGVMDILDYTNVNKFKTTRTLGGWDENGSGRIELVSGLWRNTAAINRIDFLAFAGNFTQYSSFALYGIKG
jgi:trimeric autotransporter adhesin